MSASLRTGYRDMAGVLPWGVALMTGALVVAPGQALCLRRCGWVPPVGVEVSRAAIAHRDESSHPVVFRRAVRAAGGAE
jgi:hypothetical protein